jgi:group II intron reverse transcriptase/maturase
MLLERILSNENLNLAFKRVKSNKGSHGIDGMGVEKLYEYLRGNGKEIKESILNGRYKVQPVRRVEIPKADGGVRLLGIPTVLDRMIQQAIYQVIEPIFDATFSLNSYGFRKKKSAKEAVLKSRGYIEQGYDWVVDIDLEKFFDRVNHDILMSRVARKIKDKRVLKLIRVYLESGVMINGVVLSTDEGTPQGGNLSPLLANIMLDDLDKELEKRDHKFCRYADDCNIYVSSQKSAERVMKSVSEFIEKRLKLKVNKSKSAVDRPWKRKFLGFSFYRKKDGIGIRVHNKSINKLITKLKHITCRSKSISVEVRLESLAKCTIGWVNYFAIADMKSICQEIDGWLRRRIRMCIWKQWKKTRTRRNNLIKLGVRKPKAWEWANTRKGYWRISNSYILSTTLTNKVIEKLGFVSLTSRFNLVNSHF